KRSETISSPSWGPGDRSHQRSRGRILPGAVQERIRAPGGALKMASGCGARNVRFVAGLPFPEFDQQYLFARCATIPCILSTKGAWFRATGSIFPSAGTALILWKCTWSNRMLPSLRVVRAMFDHPNYALAHS